MKLFTILLCRQHLSVSLHIIFINLIQTLSHIYKLFLIVFLLFSFLVILPRTIKTAKFFLF